MAKRKTTLSDELQAQYKREVARVNKQLYRLEKAYAGNPDKLMETAYGTIQRDIKAEFGEQKRFGKAMPENLKQFRKRMNIISRFYDKPSATLSGMKNVYGKRAATLSKKLGKHFTADDLKNFFDTGIFKALTDRFGSAKAMKYWKTIEVQRDRVAKHLEEGKKVSFRGRLAKEINLFVNQEAKEMYGVEFDAMLRDYLLEGE